MSTAPLLAVDSLSVSIGRHSVVSDVSFDLGAGEVVGLVGASGSGKSMTALAILRLLPERARVAGTVRLAGDVIPYQGAELNRVRGRRIGMVFQEPMTALNPLMRIGDQVAEAVLVHGIAKARDAVALARDALDAVGLMRLPGVLDRYPHELSGGQRQRAAIAAAVVLKPALLIADEPTTALDVGTQAQILALLHELVLTHGMGLLLVSHDLAVIARLAQRVLVMHAGTIVESQPLIMNGLVRSIPRFTHERAQALLAATHLPAKRSGVVQPGAVPAPPLLEASGIVREYGRGQRGKAALRAVDNVSLMVRGGESVGLVGESGAGKSSLLRTVLALERPQAGEVRLLGEPFSTATGARLRRLRRHIQAVFQDPYGSFDPQWPVARSIAEPFYLLDSLPSAAERRNRVAAALEQVGMVTADGARYPDEFSGGQRQRIAIARALITQPAVVVLDEAVSALDVLLRAQILDLLTDLSSRLGLSYLFVSHDLNVVRSITDRVYVMQHGRIVEHGITAEVFAAPARDYTRELLAATPRL